MNAPVLFGPDRKRLNLGARLGKGGEGEVYAIADQPSHAVKVYTTNDAHAREPKIAAMIQAGLARQTSLVAFPVELVTDQRGRFAGFTMARVSEHKALHELYAPGARKAEFPKADYRFLVHTAANVARAVAAVHHAGCVIGDINHSGILVSDKATVALIDADSFQVSAGAARYLCRVGVPEYTPPELQGMSLESITRTQDHDAFGLAVVIFQLLWMGRHPYSGRYARGEMPIERAISEHRFAYSEKRSVGMSPPPAAPLLGHFAPQIRAAFEAAFAGPGARPSAKVWVGLLDELERGLRACAQSKLHHYPAAATECPWCRMEQALGVQLFLPPTTFNTTTASVGDGSTLLDVGVLWRAIEAIQAPVRVPPMPPLRATSLAPSPAAQAARGTIWARRVFAALALAGSLFIILVNPSIWPVALAGGALGWWLLGVLPNDAAEISKAAETAHSQFSQALEGWWARASSEPFDRAKAELQAARDELARLPAEEKRRTTEYTQNRRAEQLKAYLQGFQIRRYKIKGLGPSKLATLTSYGIESAYDVTAGKVLNVPGFGPVNTRALTDWRARIEARFAYDPNSNQLDRIRLSAIKTEIMLREATLRRVLQEGPRRLAGEASGVMSRRAIADPQLQKLYERREQAAADMKALGKAMPALPTPPTTPPTGAPSRPATGSGAQPQPAAARPFQPMPGGRAGATTCPSCGGGMVIRVARRGRQRGRTFWGCSRYPRCRGTRPI